MGVDQTSLDRIRNATFPNARRGYDKHEVEKFLARLAEWLETGGGEDEERSDAVKRELQRVGERTGAILAEAEDAARKIRAEAEEAAQKLRGDADAYATQTRSAVDREAGEHRSRMDREVDEALAEAETKAQRIVEDGMRRREDLESVIADLVGRRDEVLADIDDLSAKLDAAVSEHRPEDSDPYGRPEDLDPEPDTGDETLQAGPDTGGGETLHAGAEAESDEAGPPTELYESDEYAEAGYDEPEDDEPADAGDGEPGPAEQSRPSGGEGGVRSS
jgi:DivIVA domain-containing protein